MSEPRPSASTATQPLVLAASVIFLGNVASRVLGLVREQLAASRFGAGNDIAAFTVADNLNTLLFDLIVNGMLQAAIVPVLALLVLGGLATAEFRRASGIVLVGVAGLAGLVAVAGIAAAPAFISLITTLTGDAASRGDQTRTLAIDNLRIILISLPLLAAAAVLSASLYALQRPAGPAIGATMRNGAIVISMLLLSGSMGVRSMAVGVVAGAAAMLVVMVAALRRHDALPVPAFSARDPHVRKMSALALPVFAGFLVSSVVVVIDRNLAWGAEENAIGAMRYATTLVQLVLGLVAAAVSVAALPRLAHAHAVGEDRSMFDRELSRALRLVTVLMIPAVVALGVLARPIVALLFEHGATDREAADLIVLALLFYLPGHLLAAYDQVLIFAFYAQQNTILPVLVGVGAASVYLVSAPLLAERHGMAGLVAANSLQLVVHTLIMIWLGWKRFGGPAFAQLPETIGKSAGGAAVMAGAGVLAWQATGRATDALGVSGQADELIVVLAALVASGVAYLVACKVIGIGELDDIRAAVLKR
ncbi:MAG: oligosaccharide flippase family protein [Thermomicrobiales bacterium]|nr:oligosaccharide flippase family protein [Thermomicrobiales bacterium]